MLIINSPQELYQICKDLKISDPPIIHFMGIMYLYLHGCPCDAEKHWDSACLVYREMYKSDLSEFKSEKKCNKIQFNLDGKFLFEI